MLIKLPIKYKLWDTCTIISPRWYAGVFAAVLTGAVATLCGFCTCTEYCISDGRTHHMVSCGYLLGLPRKVPTMYTIPNTNLHLLIQRLQKPKLTLDEIKRISKETETGSERCTRSRKDQRRGDTPTET